MEISKEETLERIFKYLIEGMIVSMVAFVSISKKKIKIKEIALIGLTSSVIFAILDTISPTISINETV